LAAIETGPDAMFDISINGAWARHGIAQGGAACAAYL